MKHSQIILEAILSKNIFEYILIDKKLTVLKSSDTLNVYLDAMPKVGEDIVDYLPELVGSEDSIEDIFNHSNNVYRLDAVYKNGYYVNISVEYYDSNTLLVLLCNITDIAFSKQKLLQYSNESLLLNNTLQTILDNENAYVFVTYNEEIVFSNKQFMHYFNVEKIEELKGLKLDFYKHLDPMLKSYDALFEQVNSKEEYITVNNDTFILQASLVESTHKLFTLTKITNLSNKLQYDTLTKAHKKEYFNKQLEKLILLGEEAAVVVLDLDNFKKINDRFGHQIGDEVLQEFSALIQENIRGEDVFARWGGEEFLLLLKHTNMDDALTKVKKLCTLIDTHIFKEVKHITSSLGMAWISENDTLHSVLLRADKALYEAKNSGKNRVVLKMLKKSKK